MADYREISQQYAQGGIKAVILLNGGAAIALLSQAAGLLSIGLIDEVILPMVLWATGTTLGGATWVLAFLSTRYVDKSEQERPAVRAHLQTSDRYMASALILIALSLASFAAGCFALALGFARHGGAPT